MSRGRFGEHGGQYIPETLMNAVIELEGAYNRYKDDADFRSELAALLNDYAGRPSRMTEDLGGAKIYLKREDLNHTGAHKINNVLGQALLAKRMGKTRLIAETGAGQHGVATATAAALFGMECEVFMGREDIERQALNVYRMRLLGSTVHSVESGTGTLKDAVSETMREWTRAEGRRQRDDARVDAPHRRHALRPRLVHGAAPLPYDSARLPGRHIEGDKRTAGAGRGQAARRRARMRRRRLERDRDLL